MWPKRCLSSNRFSIRSSSCSGFRVNNSTRSVGKMDTETEILLLIGLLALLALTGGEAVQEVTGMPEDPNISPETSLKDRIRIWAAKYGQEPALVLAFCQVESSFNPSARNGNSVGLMQIIPHYWYSVIETTDPEELMDPETNIKAGCAILAYFQSKGYIFPDEADVYNLGETAYHQGVRNTSYQHKVASAYASFGGMNAS